MAFGNKFVKTQKRAKPIYLKVRSPQGIEYLLDPWKDAETMLPWELTEAIRFFLEAQDTIPSRTRQKPNRFIHFQRS